MAEQIKIWENDPASSDLVGADKPRIDQPPFRFFFPPPRLDPDPDPATPNFRYWNAAAALRRGTDFWEPAVAVNANTQWFSGPTLEVRLDVGVRWNSAYDRLALNFYRGKLSPGKFIYASDSADILCHELGHAILDVVQEQLWDATNEEVAAFRESFGDVSAILCSLQVPTFRSAVLAGGALYRSSRLSRLAEQFGTGLHTLFPDDADPDCLRNAYNSFRYVPPGKLDARGPSSKLTSKPHSFSRVFTGAVFEALAGMLAVHAKATPDQLRDVSIDLRDIIVAAVRSAPLVSQYYASVAAKMMLAARDRNDAYGKVFKDAFVGRSILSLESANAILRSPTPQNDTGFAGEVAENTHAPTIGALASGDYGLTEPLFVEMPVNPEVTAARSGTRGEKSLSPVSAEDAARTFVDRLFLKGLVDYGDVDAKDRKGGRYPVNPSPVLSTHRIKRVDGQLRLTRV